MRKCLLKSEARRIHIERQNLALGRGVVSRCGMKLHPRPHLRRARQEHLSHDLAHTPRARRSHTSPCRAWLPSSGLRCRCLKGCHLSTRKRAEGSSGRGLQCICTKCKDRSACFLLKWKWGWGLGRGLKHKNCELHGGSLSSPGVANVFHTGHLFVEMDTTMCHIKAQRLVLGLCLLWQ